MEQEMSYANSDRESDDLVWKTVESIRWDWNVASVVLIRGERNIYLSLTIIGLESCAGLYI